MTNPEILNIPRPPSRKSSIASHTSKASAYSDASAATPNPSTTIKNCQKWLCRMYRSTVYRPRYYGKPFEDRFNEDGKYFLVIASRFGKTHVYRFNKAKSLYIFGYESKIRRLCLKLITNQYFEMFVLLTILINCVFLAMTNPPEEPEYVFAGIYTLEMFFKIIAKGFAFHKYAYLRDAWNWLDFIVVIMGYITIAPGFGNYSGIRTFRVFRALRTISAVKGLKAMVNTLLMSMKMLWDVMVLTLFFICIFALIGMQLFVGVLRTKCSQPVPHNLTIPYRTYAANSSFWKTDENGDPLLCGNTTGSRLCPANSTCLIDAGGNPNFGYTNFDHFGWALMTSFQIVTLDFWENVYNNIIYSMGPWYVIYFAIVIFFGPFYLVNLVLAVVAASYENEVQANKLETDEQRKEQKRVASSYSVRRSSIMSIVYGKNETVLNETLQRTMYDIPVVTCRPATESRSEGDISSVLQIKEPDHLNQSQSLHQNWISSTSPSASISPKPDKSFVAKPENQPKKTSKAKRRLNRFRRWVKELVSSKYFEFFIVFCILLNTLFMAIEYHDMNPTLQYVVLIANQVFTSMFLMEMILKLIALGFYGYLKSRWNIFDGVVVIISVVDFIFVQCQIADGTGTSVLRTFRLLRILKLAQSWSTMSSLLSTIGKSLGALANLTVILGIIVYIFAVVGMQLFGKSYTPEKFGGSIPRWNFNDFFHSFLMIFRVLCGEWIEPLWDCMRATGPVAILLYVPAFIIGNFIILNLFLALLLSSFASESMEGRARKKEKRASLMQRMKRVLLAIRFASRLRRNQVGSKNEVEAAVDGQSKAEGEDKQEQAQEAEKSDENPTQVEDVDDPSKTTRPCDHTVKIYDVEPCFPKGCRVCRSVKTNPVWNLMRFKVKLLVEHRYFEWFIVLLIAASSIALAFEDVHIDENPVLKEVLRDLNIFFAIVFSLEMLLKWFGLGFVMYFSNPWNWLDFIIVIVSLVTITGDESISYMRSLRTLRALRPLRAVSRFEGMRVVISSLFHAFPGIANVLLVSMVFWLIFSIMGVQSFGGKFYKCVDADGSKLSPSITPNKTVCLARGYRWMNSNINFDNSINGFLALLQVATFEGWMEIMEDAVDSTQIGQQPCRECNFIAYLYFVVFIILGTFFILNLIIGVIIDNFNQLKQQMETVGSMDIFLTTNQRNWMNALKSAASKKPKKRITKPQNVIQGTLYDLVQSRKFEIFIMLVITINMVVMMVQHYDQSTTVENTLAWAWPLQVLNLVFTGIFIVEAILRITALRVGYFYNPWNVFDFVIVICSIIGIVLENLRKSLPISPSLLRVVRVFRVGRLLRFFEAAKGIRRLLFSLIVSLPALINIGALLFLVIFIYAVVGMSLFGNVKRTGALNEIVNFENFGNSFILLFRIMTSAGWNDILDPLMIKPPDCDPNYKNLPYGDCGQTFTAVVFFVTFIVMIFLILINMYIAIILENYNQVMEQEKIGFSNEDVDLFYQLWEVYDPKATQYIEYKDLSDFVHNLEGNLRLPKPNKAACALLNIPLLNGNMIHCLDLIQGLVKRIVSRYEDVESPGFQLVMKNMEERFKAAFPSRKQQVSTNTTMEINRQIMAANVIIKAIRKYRERKVLESLQAQILHDKGKDNQGYEDEKGGKCSEKGSKVRVLSAQDDEVKAVTSGNGQDGVDEIINSQKDVQDVVSSPTLVEPFQYCNGRNSMLAWTEKTNEIEERDHLEPELQGNENSNSTKITLVNAEQETNTPIESNT